jgi:cilla- and flagella-associated protein
MGKSLTAELIMQRSKTDNFDKIKNLNLWGNDLEDVSILRELPNVEVLSLSVNKITSLKEFSHCKKLTELYLRKNAINDLTEIQYLSGLEYLRVLWLWDNPCAEHEHYRAFVIKTLPNLVKLDNTAISPEERTSDLKINFNLDSAKPPNSHHNPYPEAQHVQHQQHAQHQQHVQHPQPQQRMEGNGGGARPTAAAAVHGSRAEREEGKHASARRNNPPKESKCENILCAVLALLKELDANGLELVKRDVERKLAIKKT